MDKKTKIIAVIMAAIFLAAGSGFLTAQGRSEKAPAPTQSQTQDQAVPVPLTTDASSLQAIQYSFREVAKKVLPTVVELNVTETIRQQAPQSQFPFNFPFDRTPQGGGNGRTYQQSALGSGIIVRHAGDKYYVLTNNHVVDNATDISVKLYDDKTFKASVVGTDSRKDLAMVSFDSKDTIPVAELGDSNGLQTGDIVLAVGNPFGYASSITMGIVSALGRRGPEGQASNFTDYIQTDAAINQGNSGGALVNIQGQVIGVNTWIAAPSGGNIGLGFAIPINNATGDINDFISKGKVAYGWLGVQITDIQDTSVYPGFAKDLGVENQKGAMVLNLYKGSPANKSGMLPGDYITRVDTTDIQNSTQLTQVVGGLLAGKTYQFQVIRSGEKVTIPVTIGVRDDQDAVAQYKNLWPGMTVLDISDQIRQDPRVSIPQGTTGVVVAYLPDQTAPAAVAGFQVGDVITAINGKAVRNMLDYYKNLNDKSKSDMTFSIVRQGTQISIGIGR
jgi:Do/DeqQ family serine protease